MRTWSRGICDSYDAPIGKKLSGALVPISEGTGVGGGGVESQAFPEIWVHEALPAAGAVWRRGTGRCRQPGYLPCSGVAGNLSADGTSAVNDAAAVSWRLSIQLARPWAGNCRVVGAESATPENPDDENKEIVENEKIRTNNTTNEITSIPNSTITDLKELLGAEIVVKNSNGEVVSNESNLATGYVVNDKYTISVLGDVSGDGVVDARDSLRILKYAVDTYKIEL